MNEQKKEVKEGIGVDTVKRIMLITAVIGIFIIGLM